MILTIEKTHKQEIEIKPPMFWKENTSYNPSYIAFLDDETAVRVFSTDNIVMIWNGKPDVLKGEILKAYSDYFPCDETEFFREYDDAFEAARLRPMVRTTQNVYSENY